jgi:hypothetical protein
VVVQGLGLFAANADGTGVAAAVAVRVYALKRQHGSCCFTHPGERSRGFLLSRWDPGTLPPGNRVFRHAEHDATFSLQVSQSVLVDPVLHPAATATSMEVQNATPFLVTMDE